MDKFFSPIYTLYTYFPLLFFYRVLVILVLSASTIYIAENLRKSKRVTKSQSIITVFTLCYYYFILFFTVLGRRNKEFRYPISIDVEESFAKVFCGMDKQLLLELLINILIFLPIGIGLALLFKGTSCRMIKVIGVALLLSLNIEILQFVLCSGYFEVADILKYLFGTIIGYVMGCCTTYVLSFMDNKAADN